MQGWDTGVACGLLGSNRHAIRHATRRNQTQSDETKRAIGRTSSLRRSNQTQSDAIGSKHLLAEHRGSERVAARVRQLLRHREEAHLHASAQHGALRWLGRRVGGRVARQGVRPGGSRGRAAWRVNASMRVVGGRCGREMAAEEAEAAEAAEEAEAAEAAEAAAGTAAGTNRWPSHVDAAAAEGRARHGACPRRLMCAVVGARVGGWVGGGRQALAAVGALDLDDELAGLGRARVAVPGRHTRSTQKRSEALRSAQKRSEALRSALKRTQKRSEAIRSTPKQSEASFYLSAICTSECSTAPALSTERCAPCLPSKSVEPRASALAACTVSR